MMTCTVHGAVSVSGPVLAFITGFQENETPWLRVMRRLAPSVGVVLADSDGCEVDSSSMVVSLDVVWSLVASR